MKIFFLISSLAAMTYGGTVNYNTTGSTLSCNGVGGCAQNTTTSVTIGGLTFTYNSGSGSGVVTPSIVNLGNIVATGTASNVSVTGLLLTINVNSTPPGSSGALPNGAISGSISTNSSGASILFSPNNTTTGFGTLPGVTISGGGQSFLYQILNPTLGLQAPTVGNPVGQTSIQGAVTDTTAPVTTVNYNTSGSTLSCNGVGGCVQNTSTSVTVGGLTITYNSASGSGVVMPSNINLGNVVSTGTNNNASLSGLLLTINVNSTPPGASGTLPSGAISGSISTSQSSANLSFTPNNTTSSFGTLPGVTIGSSPQILYQVLNTSLGLEAPTIGNPVGQTSIQGTVTNLTSSAASVTFVTQDVTTEGSWKGKYGSDGEIIAVDSFNPPAYATVNFGTAQVFEWALTSDPRAMQEEASATRIASTYYEGPGFTMDLNLTDGASHQVAMYFLDWDGGGRAENVTIMDAATQTVLDTRSISGFVGGQYLVWNIKGHVTVKFAATSGANAVVNGVFFSVPTV